MKKIILIFLPILVFASNINWVKSFNQAISEAKNQNKHIMVFYESKYCRWCKKMLNTTLKNSEVIKRINKNFISVKVLKEKNDYPDFIYSKYTPTTFFLTVDGKNIIRPVVGYWDTESFLSFLDDVKKALKK